jgi:hypothetical protein
MPIRMLINEIDDYIIVAGLLLPLIAWAWWAFRKRSYTVRSLLILTGTAAVSLALLGGAFVRELIE